MGSVWAAHALKARLGVLTLKCQIGYNGVGAARGVIGVIEEDEDWSSRWSKKKLRYSGAVMIWMLTIVFLLALILWAMTYYLKPHDGMPGLRCSKRRNWPPHLTQGESGMQARLPPALSGICSTREVFALISSRTAADDFLESPMTPAERIQAALLKSQAKSPPAKYPMPQPAEWTATTAPSSVTVSEENLAALLRSLTPTSR